MDVAIELFVMQVAGLERLTMSLFLVHLSFESAFKCLLREGVLLD